MSNVILCHGQQTTKPYTVSGLGINIYSVEELCYLISQNAHTLDSDFMDERLCSFLESDMGLRDLGKRLKIMIREKCSLYDFVSVILEEIGYCDGVEIKSIKQVLVESAGLSPARKHKSRGDNLLKARKFARALDEYIGTLEKIDKDSEPILYGAVLHNMGTTYAKLLRYKKASEYYLDAYRLNMDDESLILHLVCCNMHMDKEQYDKMLVRCGYSDRVLNAVNNLLAKKNDYEESQNKYALELKELKDLKNKGKISKYYESVDATIDEWKREYRMNMILR